MKVCKLTDIIKFQNNLHISFYIRAIFFSVEFEESGNDAMKLILQNELLKRKIWWKYGGNMEEIWR